MMPQSGNGEKRDRCLPQDQIVESHSDLMIKISQNLVVSFFIPMSQICPCTVPVLLFIRITRRNKLCAVLNRMR